MADLAVETIGCDLGDKWSSLFVLKADGTSERPKSVKTTRDGFREFFSRPKAHVVIEVGTHSRWVAGLLAELGHEVTVANARRVQLISQNDSKTDDVDAELLARLGRVDRSLLAPIQHRGTTHQVDLTVPKARDTLVECRTRLINFCRGLVKSFGHRLSKCRSEAFHRQIVEEIPRELLPALKPVLKTLKNIDAAIEAEDKKIEQLAKKYPDVAVISQPSGVGTLTALVFLLTLEDKARFKSSRLVGSFLGLCPRRDQSGDGDPQLRITKAGDPHLRRLLIQCASYILGPFGPDTELKRWGHALALRGGKNAKKRARVAVARKLAVLMHRLWVTGEEYQPLGYGRPQPQAA